MKILLILLTLFGLGCSTKAADLAPKVTETIPPVETTLAKPQTIPLKPIEYCPLSGGDCFNMQERVAARRVNIQPILITDGKNPEAMKKDWQDFVASLPEEIASAIQSPKVIVVEPADIELLEPDYPILNRQRLAKKIGVLPAHTLAVVYWDLSLGGNQTYDWDHGIYYRSFYSESTSGNRENLGRRFESTFLAWLINIHV